MKQLNKILILTMTFLICTAFAGKHHHHAVKKNNQPPAGAEIIHVQSANPEFIIKLQSNPTTGYSWAIQQMDRSLIKIKSHQYIPPSQQMPGAGGIEEWHFLAKPAAFTAPKSTRIDMIYVRPWEKTPVKEVSYWVKTS